MSKSSDKREKAQRAAVAAATKPADTPVAQGAADTAGVQAAAAAAESETQALVDREPEARVEGEGDAPLEQVATGTQAQEQHSEGDTEDDEALLEPLAEIPAEPEVEPPSIAEFIEAGAVGPLPLKPESIDPDDLGVVGGAAIAKIDRVPNGVRVVTQGGKKLVFPDPRVDEAGYEAACREAAALWPVGILGVDLTADPSKHRNVTALGQQSTRQAA